MTQPLSCANQKQRGAAEQGRVNTGDRDELGPVLVAIALHIHISFHAFAWDRPKNELRAV